MSASVQRQEELHRVEISSSRRARTENMIVKFPESRMEVLGDSAASKPRANVSAHGLDRSDPVAGAE